MNIIESISSVNAKNDRCIGYDEQKEWKLICEMKWNIVVNYKQKRQTDAGIP